MKWYDALYTGESCRDQKDAIIEEVSSGVYRRNLYLITLAANGRDLLDIRKAAALSREGLSSMLPMIVGIATGREEAGQVARAVIEDCYRQTKDVDVRKFLEK